MSLCQLTEWCNSYFGANEVLETNTERPFDIPWMVLDANLAHQTWQWQPQTSIHSVLEEIAAFAMVHENWCKLSNS